MSSTPSVSADLLDDAVAATIQAGAAIMDYFRDSFSVHDKSPDNPVTDADLAADKLLRQQLGRVMPSAGWLSEETVDNADRLDREWVWVVDPLDGTKEFVMGIPEFTVSVGLVKAGHPVLGVILNPARGELYYGRQGNGVAFQRQPVSASQRSELKGALVDASRSERTRGEFAPFEELVTVRTVGSIAYKLARVAAGQADATWSRGPKNEWDICAGTFLVQESGGRCVDLDGSLLRFNQPYPKANGVVAAGPTLFAAVMTLIDQHGPARADSPAPAEA